MKSKIIWLSIISLETALALYFAIGAAVSYGRAASLTCQPSRSSLTPPLCATPSATPMPRTSARRNLLTNSTAKEGWATWYSRQSCQREGTGGKSILMANGKPLDDRAMTCAMWIVGKHGRPLRPDGRLVSVRNVQTGMTVQVAWADNGPGCVPRSRGVICDLTPAAMLALAGPDGIKAGRVKVKIERMTL